MRTIALALCLSASVVAQERPTLFITPTEDNFETYLTAAVVKKGVPVTITAKPEGATYVLKASAVEVLSYCNDIDARCLVMNCCLDRGTTAVTLLKGDRIAWAYSVNKGGQKHRQALAEAIAKYLKRDVFHVH